MNQKENKGFVVGVDIGGTKIRVGLVDANANVSAFATFWSSEFKGSPNAPQNIAAAIRQHLVKSKIHVKDIKAIVLGLPATLDRDQKVILSCPNFKDLEGISFAEAVIDELSVPVILERDVNLAILGEYWKGAGQGFSDVVGVFVGTGLGCGIILNGRLFTGSHGAAAELGHIPVPGRHDLCGCGNKGCIELYAAGVALERTINQLPSPKPLITEIFLHAANGDPFWVAMVNDFLEMLATAVATVINIVDPQLVIISGGITQMPSFPYDDLIAKIFDHVRKPEPARSLLFKKGLLGDLAAMIGAAYLGFGLGN